MTATVQVRSFHAGASGALPTGAGDTLWVDGARFHLGDSDPTTDPATTFLPIPAGVAVNYSYRKHLALKVTATPVGSISNLRWYSDGVAIATGVTVYASVVANPAGYVVASAADTSALVNAAAGGSVVTAAADASTYSSSGVVLTLNAGTVLTNPATGYGTQPLLVMQAAVAAVAAGTGAFQTGARQYFFRYNET